MKPLKYLPTLLSLFVAMSCYSQSDAKNNNVALLDSLYNVYGKLCSEKKKSEYPREKIKTDKELIAQLNIAYGQDTALHTLLAYLAKHGFIISQKKTGNDRADTVVYYKHAGNLRGFVYVRSLNDSLLFKKIILATDSKFSCTSREGSLVYHYIDFAYLKKLAGKMKFPLKISSSNVEVESR